MNEDPGQIACQITVDEYEARLPDAEWHINRRLFSELGSYVAKLLETNLDRHMVIKQHDR